MRLAAAFLAEARRLEVPVTRTYAHAETDTTPWAHATIQLVAEHSVELLNKYNTIYYAELTVGGQPFVAQFDTGSSNLWVQSTACPPQVCDAWNPTRHAYDEHHKFDAGKSPTFRDAGRPPFDLRYGMGSCTGTLGYDTVTIANMTVEEQAFLQVGSVAQPFPSSPFDGLVGLAFSRLATPYDAKPWLYTLAASSALDRLTFSFKMASDKSGTLVFGDVPQDRYTASGISWAPVAAVGGYSFWQVPATVAIGEERADALGVVDSGTSCLILPEKMFGAFLAALPPGATLDTAPCDGKGLPSITFAIMGRDYEILPEDYLLEAYQDECWACVQGLGSQLLLGDVFHRKFAVTYDFEYRRIGLPILGETWWQAHAPMCVVPPAMAAALLALFGLVWRCERRRRVDTQRMHAFSLGAV